MGNLRGSFAKNLRDLRESQAPKLSRDKLGEEVGVTGTTVYRWESGENWPEPENIEGLAKFFQISVSQLMTGKVDGQSDRENLICEILRKVPDADLEALQNIKVVLDSVVSGKNSNARPDRA